MTFVALANDDVIHLSKHKTVTRDEIAKIAKGFEKAKEDLIFYHWTNFATGIRWVLQGGIDKGEVDFLSIPVTNNIGQLSGAGVYLAKSPGSSRVHGKIPVVFRMKKGTLLYDDTTVLKVLGFGLDKNEKSELGKHIPFVRSIGDDWFITNHPKNTADIVYGGLYEATIKPGTFAYKFTDMYKWFWDGVRKNGDGHLLESLFHLLSYQDGLSFARSMTINPNNPWGEFEPETFESFRKTRQDLIRRVIEGHREETVHVSNRIGFGSNNMDADQWAKNQIDEFLPKMAEGISDGRVTSYRSEGIRAGGPKKGGTFLGTLEQVAELKSNPYLSVEFAKDPKGKGYLIHYFYPDVFHYKKLKGRISNELFDLLEKTDPEKLMADKARRRSLNKRLIRELLTDHFKRYHRKSVELEKGGVKFLRDLVSIHPFSDFNGRISRMYYEIACGQAGETPPYHILSDFDLLLSTKKLTQIYMDSTVSFSRVADQMLEEFLMARSERRAADFSKIDFAKEFWTPLKAIGMGDDVLLTERHLRLIQERRFTELFDEVIGPAWRNFSTDARLKVFSEITDEAVLADYIKSLKSINFFEDFKPVMLLDLLNTDFMQADGRGLIALNVLYDNVDTQMKKQIGSVMKTVSEVSGGWESPYFESFLEKVTKDGYIKPSSLWEILSIKDQYWLKRDKGFKMVVDLFHKVEGEEKLEVAKMVSDMWSAGYRWKDRKFADFALEVSALDNFDPLLIVRTLYYKDASNSDIAFEVLRRLVKKGLKNQMKWQKKLVDSVLMRDHWLEKDEVFRMLIQLYKRKNSYVYEAVKEHSDKLVRLMKTKSCQGLIYGFLF